MSGGEWSEVLRDAVDLRNRVEYMDDALRGGPVARERAATVLELVEHVVVLLGELAEGQSGFELLRPHEKRRSVVAELQASVEKIEALTSSSEVEGLAAIVEAQRVGDAVDAAAREARRVSPAEYRDGVPW